MCILSQICITVKKKCEKSVCKPHRFGKCSESRYKSHGTAGFVLPDEANRLLMGSVLRRIRGFGRILTLGNAPPYRVKAFEAEFVVHSIHPRHYMTVLAFG